MGKERGIHELYRDDFRRADELLWGRKSDPITRRGFLRGGGLAIMSLALGAKIPFAEAMPEGLIPAAFAETTEGFVLKGKEGLKILNDRPLNAETPPHLLDDDITPASRLFVRNNGLMPDWEKEGFLSNWKLSIDGEVKKPLVLTLDELKRRFKHYTYHLVLECAGNGRAGFIPPTSGNQWTYGAVGCPLWTGVRLKDVLKASGVKPNAVYIGYYGFDLHLSGDPERDVISRGVPISKALEDYTLVAFEMNGKPIPPEHGFPARLICPGTPGSTSGKWLKRIQVRDRVHDGAKMTGHAYRLPKHPVAPGSEVDETDMVIIEKMPVKSLITFPKSGLSLPEKDRRGFACRGFAWTGDGAVERVDVSFDFGQTWKKTKLKKPRNRYGWQRWETTIALPSKGYFEIWARGTDSTGKMQPMVVPGWNPEGYVNNAMPRIAVTVV